MSRISIVATTNRLEVLPALRRLLPDVVLLELKQRLTQGNVLVERELFMNDHEEVHPLLRRIVAELQSHGVPFQLYERCGASASTEDPGWPIPVEDLERIMGAFEHRLEHRREYGCGREEQP
jgi:hypothetical protein